MLFLIILLSVAMVVDCVVLVFLVLMQLPKKEAGAGLAFGGAATDALFGAGSGNFLTKATKYSAVVFFALAIVLGLIQSYRAHQPGSDFMERVKAHQNEQPALTAPPAPTTPPPAASGPPPLTAPTTNLLVVPDNTQATPSNAAPATPVEKK
jgi:preprotein translocase subunit SecG